LAIAASLTEIFTNKSIYQFSCTAYNFDKLHGLLAVRCNESMDLLLKQIDEKLHAIKIPNVMMSSALMSSHSIIKVWQLAENVSMETKIRLFRQFISRQPGHLFDSQVDEAALIIHAEQASINVIERRPAQRSGKTDEIVILRKLIK
jgi:hypothetical protein